MANETVIGCYDGNKITFTQDSCEYTGCWEDTTNSIDFTISDECCDDTYSACWNNTLTRWEASIPDDCCLVGNCNCAPCAGCNGVGQVSIVNLDFSNLAATGSGGTCCTYLTVSWDWHDDLAKHLNDTTIPVSFASGCAYGPTYNNDFVILRNEYATTNCTGDHSHATWTKYRISVAMTAPDRDLIVKIETYTTVGGGIWNSVWEAMICEGDGTGVGLCCSAPAGPLSPYKDGCDYGPLSGGTVTITKSGSGQFIC